MLIIKEKEKHHCNWSKTIDGKKMEEYTSPKGLYGKETDRKYIWIGHMETIPEDSIGRI